MLLTELNKDIAKVYINNNNITGAFIWKENNRWSVFIGDSDSASGFREKEFKLKRDAIKYCKILNDLISEMIKD